MRKISLSILLLATFIYMNAQPDNWKVYHNKRLILATGEESETKNIRIINKTDFDKAGELIVVYEGTDSTNEWSRTIAIIDEKDSTLFGKTGINKIELSNADLQKMLQGKREFKIYTWAIPKDPVKAAAIRVRRVHLCTVELK